MSTEGFIRLRGARTHNLQDLSLILPRNRLIVFTGPSGSGKSSLAVDTLFACARRGFLLTLPHGANVPIPPAPPVDSVEGLPPMLCVSQRTVQPRPRSTVATYSEIHDHLRLLFARAGVQHCPNCDLPIEKQTPTQILRETLAWGEGAKLFLLAPIVASSFGSHAETLEKLRKTGFPRARIDGVVHDLQQPASLDPARPHSIDLIVDRLVLRPNIEDRLRDSLNAGLKAGDGRVCVAEQTDDAWRERQFNTKLSCLSCGRTLPDVVPQSLSFLSPHGACPTCGGAGLVGALDPAKILPHASWSLARVLARIEELLPSGLEQTLFDPKEIAQLLGGKKNKSQLNVPVADWPKPLQTVLLHGADDGFPGLLPRLQSLSNELRESGDDPFQTLCSQAACPDCAGTRLNDVARAVRWRDTSIHALTKLDVDAAFHWFAAREDELKSSANEAAKTPGVQTIARAEATVEAVLAGEIASRLRFLREVGLGYLSLDRPADTLSGGELQRARLATSLGGGLFGVGFVLDEPTLGLHPSDTDRLLASLRSLRDRGNSVLVVEHDEAILRAADYLVDVGPGAGRDGGRLLASGSVAEVLANPQSVTGDWLTKNRGVAATPRNVPRAKPPAADKSLIIRAPRSHNLKGDDVRIPLHRLVALTGVSGSGKSTLAFDILRPAIRRSLGLSAPDPGAHAGVEGLEHIERLVELEQRSAGRSPRSNALSLTGLGDALRELFAQTKLARARGYKANRFSANVRGGRCETCRGLGRSDAAGPDDLETPCPDCAGTGFLRATLDVRFKGASIADVLNLTVAEALDLFVSVPTLTPALRALSDVGLGYLRLGQTAPTLSGGEMQRVQIANELQKPIRAGTLYLLDEPTSGLHFVDVGRLLTLLRRLVENGGSVVVIEHHLDVIAAADWVIDLGPCAGEAGGRLVAPGTPFDVANTARSITGKHLREHIA